MRALSQMHNACWRDSQAVLMLMYILSAQLFVMHPAPDSTSICQFNRK